MIQITNRVFTDSQIINTALSANGLMYDIKTLQKTYKNTTGAPATVLHLTVVAELTSGSNAGNVVPFDPAGLAGEQHPIGVSCQQLTDVPINGTSKIDVCNHGEIDRGMIKFTGATTLDTVVGGRRVEDILITNCQNLKLVKRTDISQYGNY